MKNFFSVEDVVNVYDLIKEAITIKKNPYGFQHIGKNKTIGLVFFNPSLRTRISCQKAAYNLGCNIWVLDLHRDSWKIEMEDGNVMKDTQEHIKEAISVMSLYCDILAVRTFPHLIDRDYDYNEILFKKVLNYSKVPVVNLESATLHPLQSLADVMTIAEFRPFFKSKVVLSWVPHTKPLPHSVANSFSQWISKIEEIDFTITCPEQYDLYEKFSDGVSITYKQNEAFLNADFIYAKNWSSYMNYGKILCHSYDWMITEKKMKKTNEAKFMHCLPVRRNIVVEDSVLDSPYSIVLQQAENRIYATQIIFLKILQSLS
ncbi:MAG: acetylornithine carbamoyltransferase [Flavobacteriales bacterium]|jgi:N-succinyl-L-ornithine transcarbamylase|uniref:acetylornithine carbamoyltransferase n=1 Tax=Blattabacterium sp. (Mastotermes darwiniensis) TaxID=39768 RepID=UPI000231DF62|nr:acetylornithine carbamoyltransferase [Blattabacterium sp. (Mastotermes darwiniensis)]AER40378.1 ornithine carbamoyltransferase [Blattabacterium sp. (Mastotermes darwiniensis) str. MADAR]MDR1804901.1 acetylornithine carbamoyltransferase [Flavobacteriales bacterium]